MILKLPEKSRLRTYALISKEHPEFNGQELIGEPIDIGVKSPKVTHNVYIKKQGYTYLWEPSNLTDLSDIYYSIWLIYPKGKRPTEIEIENYREEEIIDRPEYLKQLKELKEIEYKKMKEETFPRPCMSCGFEIRKEYAHAIKNNWCPSCGSKIR